MASLFAGAGRAGEQVFSGTHLGRRLHSISLKYAQDPDITAQDAKKNILTWAIVLEFKD